MTQNMHTFIGIILGLLTMLACQPDRFLIQGEDRFSKLASYSQLGTIIFFVISIWYYLWTRGI